jgi:hypothetical protein
VAHGKRHGYLTGMCGSRVPGATINFRAAASLLRCLESAILFLVRAKSRLDPSIPGPRGDPGETLARPRPELVLIEGRTASLMSLISMNFTSMPASTQP